MQDPVANPIVPEDSIGWPGQVGFAGVASASDLGWLLGQNAKALRNQHELGDGCNLQLVHDAAAATIDRALAGANNFGNRFIGMPFNQRLKHLA